MIPLSPRLAWRRRRLRNEPVPADGRPLTEYEGYLPARAEFAALDGDGTRRVAADEEAAELLAAADEGWE